MGKYYPLLLDIKGKKCTVIGGGSVAQRKVMSLLQYNAKITVISPEVTKTLQKLGDEGHLKLERRPYRQGDLGGSTLVYVATDNKEVNFACYQEAEKNNIMLNVVDKPTLCNFIVPAVHRQGSLAIAVSTEGKSPMLSKKIKEEIAGIFGDRYGEIIDAMGEIREKALKEIKNEQIRRELFHHLTYGNSFIKREDVNYCIEKMWEIYNSHKGRVESENY